MSVWKESKLIDVLDELIDYRGKTPNKTESGIPLITAKIVKDGGLLTYNEFISESDYDSWMVRGFPKKGDLVLTTEAPLGEVALLSGDKVALAQRIVTLRGKKDVLDTAFLKYFFQSEVGQLRLHQRATGSTVLGIKQSELRKVNILYPNFTEQQKIASILSSLDEKIETNRKINIRLEELAQALFKSWFIDFEPFGGKMPEDWEEGKLGDICKCVLGGTPNRANPEFWGGDIPWINSGEVNKFRIFEPSEYITELGLEKSATKLLPKGTVVLAITGATLGQVSLLEIDTCANQSVVGILETLEMPFTYLYPFINSAIAELLKLQTGGAQQHINKQNVESMTIRIPSNASSG